MTMGELAPLRAKAEQEHSTDFTALWSGQAAPLASEMPAEALTLKLASLALARFKQLDGGKWLNHRNPHKATAPPI